MNNNYYYLFLIAILISCQPIAEKDNDNSNTIETPTEIAWDNFKTAAFDTAEKEGKLVFLDIGANWCHWCHVMDDSTYTDKKVQEYLTKHFILCREDQDARPDLYAKYRKWGWPALIVFNAEGEELLQLKGYQPKKRFLKKLKSVVKNPLPIENIAEQDNSEDFIGNEQMVLNTFNRKLDYEKGGYKWRNKSLQSDGIQLALNYYNENDSLKQWADLTIQNSFLLVDPVWSGVYQYSANRRWDNQHYEKLLKFQADYILAYALYGAKNKQSKSIKMAENIYAYCVRFLGNETPLFYNSQNADLVSGVHSGEYYELNEEDRLAQGAPSIDETIYLKENAAFAFALSRLWAATDNAKYLDRGIQMLDYILDNYKHANNLYKREISNTTLFAMEDNRQLLETIICYGEITGEERYKKCAKELGTALLKHFNTTKGLVAATGDIIVQSNIVIKDNIKAILTLNRLGHYIKDDAFIKQAHTQNVPATLMNSESTLPSLLLYEKQLHNFPYHAKYIADGNALMLKEKYIKQLLLVPNLFILFETAEKDKMTSEEYDFYGGFEEGTLFMCTASYCSAPIKTSEELKAFLKDNK